MKKWILLLSLPAIAFLAHSQNYIPKTTTYTTEDGLSSNEIYALHKDSRGFLWIGTQNGLDRFDGRSFVHFSKAIHPEMTIDRVQYIAEDREGYLWLLKKNETFEFNYSSPEINLYHISTGEWISVAARFGDKLPFSINDIVFMEQQPDGSIFFFDHTNNKGILFDDGKFESFPLPKLQRVSDFAIQEDGHFLLEGTFANIQDRGVFLINRAGQITHQRKANLSWTIQSEEQQQMLQFSGSDLLVGGKNIDAYQLLNPNLDEQSSTANENSILIDHAAWNEPQQLLWLKNPTEVFATQSNGDIVYQSEGEFNWYELPLLFDGTATWYACQQKGLVKVNLEPNHFRTYQLNVDGFNNSSRGIYAEEHGHLWISTINGVLHQKAGGKTLEKQTESKIFSTYFKDEFNHLWSFTLGGLSKYDLGSDEHKIIPCAWQSLANTWALYKTDEGQLWSYGNYGFQYIIDPQTGAITKSHQLPLGEETAFNVYSIQKRDDRSVWLCSDRGLYVVDEQGEYLAHYNQFQQDDSFFPAKTFHHLYRDQKGTVWLASGDNGLFEINDGEGGLKIINHYTTASGLSSNILHAIYEDDFEYLWISSNEGLMQFDKRTGKVVSYTTDEGLPHNEFNRISHFQAEDGTLYFGGLAGVISFHPKYFSQARHQGNKAALVVTDFQQYSGEEGHFENLTNQLLQSNKIELQPNDRFFKLSLNLLNYENGGSYQYRIKGLYDWQSRDFAKENELNISGLPYGQHVLEIKAQNSRQQEAVNTLSFHILVKRPFYLQWWFVGLSIIGLGVLLFLWVKRRSRRLMIVQEAEQLRELDKMKSKFFANISHELRTPITLISGPLSQLIKKHKALRPEELEESLTNIQSNSQGLLNLVNEVLDLSKLEANKLQLNTTAIKIPDFIETVVMSFESLAKVKEIDYEFVNFLAKSVIAEFDQAKLEKILNNLLSNALKFTPKNGRIQILLTQVAQDLMIKVKDSGRGMAVEDLPLIFDRYFQANRKDEQGKIIYEGGTGIGLALTRELVELMQGEISVESEINQGTEFTLRLPLVLVDSELTSEIHPSPKKTQTFSVADPRPNTAAPVINILLVEDNPSLQNFIAAVLAPFYKVRIANNGIEALDVLTAPEAKQFAAIISDVMMPEMDGFTLLERVKADDRTCGIPFVLLTARTEIEDKLRGLRIGVDDYITKPFDPEELLLRVKKLIDNVKRRGIDSEDKETAPEAREKTQNTPRLSDTPQKKETISPQDLDWLAQVEDIARREMKNATYTSEDLAKELLISKRQLYRKIKQITGLSPMKYIKTVRLQMAKRILETENINTLTEVTYAIGFENTSHFAKSFEAEFGIRPHDLLKKMELPKS